MYKADSVCVSVVPGSEEAQVGVCTCGSWTLPHGSVHHSSDLSLPHGSALGVGLHPRVNATLLISPPLSISLPKTCVRLSFTVKDTCNV